MIEYNTKNWFQHVIAFRKADTLRILFPEMLIVAIYTASVAAAWHYFFLDTDLPETTRAAVTKAFQNTTVMHSLLGFILSLLVVFRTNTAYDRWWEGRKLWGALVNATRNLAIKVDCLLPADCQREREFFRHAIPDFCSALKEHLRSGVHAGDLNSPTIQKMQFMSWQHVPNGIIHEMYLQLKKLLASGRISGDELIVLDKTLSQFADIQGGCERIHKTPIPFTYNIFLKKFIFFYIVTLPLGFVAYFDYWAVPLSVFVFYVLVSLEYIAEEIEDPFGLDANDLPTDQIARNIRKNIDEVFAKDKSRQELV